MMLGKLKKENPNSAHATYMLLFSICSLGNLKAEYFSTYSIYNLINNKHESYVELERLIRSEIWRHEGLHGPIVVPASLGSPGHPRRA